MTGYIFSHCCAIIILLLGHDTSGFYNEKVLNEGSQCTTECGEWGICKKLPDCLPMLADAIVTAARCGFDGFIEIICCPERQEKIDGRPSEIACLEFRNKIRFDIEPVDGLYGYSTTSLSSHDGSMLSSILNGDLAVEGEFPYMALLGYPNPDRQAYDPIIYSCGGSLISSKYILTAAHCLRNVDNIVPEWVRLGSVSTQSEDAQMIPVKRTIPHPEYQRSQNHHDIGLVELQVQATFSTRVKPICLQTKALHNYNAISNTFYITIGFGVTKVDGSLSDRLMKTAMLNFMPAAVCNERYKSHGRRIPMGIDSTLLCGVDINWSNRSDACQGDSGGPLLMITANAHTLLGVTAFGKACGTTAPGIYTTVPSFIDWIESEVWPEKITS